MSSMFSAMLLLTTLASLQAPLAPRADTQHAPSAAQEPLSARDSVRLLARARKAQSSFEQVRVANLPRTYGDGGIGRCDVQVGRWCYWHDAEDEDRDPPPEPARIREARDRLLLTLDTLRARLPADEWIAGQSVFYLAEAGRYDDAVRVAGTCEASATTDEARGWCDALGGYALHQQGHFAAADSAYDRALAASPETERCHWLDISVLLDDAVKPYRALPCPARDSANARFWRLSQPLYLLGGNDFRSEIFSRIARNHIQHDARTPSGRGSSATDDEFRLRYGDSRWYERQESAIDPMREPSVIGHDGGRTTANFIPDPRALADPATLSPDDWSFDAPTARVNYSPSYLKRFHRLPRHQLAVFRRGDTALVVAAYDARDDTTLSRSGLEAGLFLSSIDAGQLATPVGEVLSDAGASATLSAHVPWHRFIASIEVLDRARKAAVRARYAVRPSYATGRLSTSDLLFYAPAGSEPVKLEDALPLMLPSDSVRAGVPLGVFWEIYGVRSSGEPLSVSIGVERIGTSWMRRAAEALHLATRGAPVNVGWREAPAPMNGVATRAVAIDLSRLPPGRYRVRVTVTPRGDPPAAATREFELRG